MQFIVYSVTVNWHSELGYLALVGILDILTDMVIVIDNAATLQCYRISALCVFTPALNSPSHLLGKGSNAYLSICTLCSMMVGMSKLQLHVS